MCSDADHLMEKNDVIKISTIRVQSSSLHDIVRDKAFKERITPSWAAVKSEFVENGQSHTSKHLMNRLKSGLQL